MILFLAVLTGGLILVLLAAAIFSFVIWIRRLHYTRERFAFAALSGIISLTFVLVTAVSARSTPWYLIAELVAIFLGRQVSSPSPTLAEYGFLFLLYATLVYFALKMHKQWDGLQSQEQYQRSQRSETIGLLNEGINEVLRIVKREPPPTPYGDPDEKQFLPQLQPVTDSLAWKDQALELLSLSSSSYVFDIDSAWHDRQGCWVGTNVDTDDLVFLYPVLTEVQDNEIFQFRQYADRIAEAQSKQLGEVILAFKETIATPVNSWTDRTIRIETENTLLDDLVDFKDYRNAIYKRVLATKLSDSDLTIDEVYVPSRGKVPHSGEVIEDIEKYLKGWLNEPGQRQVALLGEYGEGKSTTALILTYNLLREYQQHKDRLPILIELRGTSPRNLSPLELLGAWASKYNVNPRALMRLHIAGRTLLIFEGFDEMALIGDSEMRLRHFATLWQFSYPQAKILITGRPNFFFDEAEMTAALGIDKPIGDRPYCDVLRLEKFTVDQIEESLRNHPSQVTEQICSLAGNNPRFLEIASRPSLLHIVSTLWIRERLWEKVDRLNSAYIMDLFVRHSYRRQGLKQAETPEFMALTTLEREYFMDGIAAYMAANRLPNQITGLRLNQVVDSLITAIPDAVSVDSPTITGETTRPLRLRLEGIDQVEHIKTDVRACGLLVDDPASPGTFRFGHKSFMEYLFASVTAEYILSDDSVKSRAIFKATRASPTDVLELPTSTEFLAELISGTSLVDKESNLASRLLSGILGRGHILIGIQRLELFWVLFMLSVLPSSLVHGYSMASPRSLGVPAVATAGILMSVVFIITVVGESCGCLTSYFDILPWATLPIAIQMTMMPILMLSFPGSQFQFWIDLCKRLGIDDSVMHQVVGTSIFPWSRRRPFIPRNNPSLGQDAPALGSNTMSAPSRN